MTVLAARCDDCVLCAKRTFCRASHPKQSSTNSSEFLQAASHPTTIVSAGSHALQGYSSPSFSHWPANRRPCTVADGLAARRAIAKLSNPSLPLPKFTLEALILHSATPFIVTCPHHTLQMYMPTASTISKTSTYCSYSWVTDSHSPLTLTSDRNKYSDVLSSCEVSTATTCRRRSSEVTP